MINQVILLAFSMLGQVERSSNNGFIDQGDNGPRRVSGAGVGVGMLRGAGDIQIFKYSIFGFVSNCLAFLFQNIKSFEISKCRQF